MVADRHYLASLPTHIVIWYLQDDAKLTHRASDLLESRDSQLFLSIASLWEMAIKLNRGKLDLGINFSDFPAILNQYSIDILPITFADVEQYLPLPLHHRDPFDRMILPR